MNRQSHMCVRAPFELPARSARARLPVCVMTVVVSHADKPTMPRERDFMGGETLLDVIQLGNQGGHQAGDSKEPECRI